MKNDNNQDRPQPGKIYSLYDLSKTGKWSSSEAIAQRQEIVAPLNPVARPDYKAMQAAADAKQLAQSEASQKLRIKHPELISGHGPVVAAKNIRIELKKAFPSVKFSVRTERYSGGNSVDVDWTDGPVTSEVAKITRKYTAGDFDGMTDCYDYKTSDWNRTFGSAKYLSNNRHFSDKLITRAICGIAGEFGIKDIPDVEDYKNGKARGTPMGNTYNERYWDWQSLITRKCSELSA